MKLSLMFWFDSVHYLVIKLDNYNKTLIKIWQKGKETLETKIESNLLNLCALDKIAELYLFSKICVHPHIITTYVIKYLLFMMMFNAKLNCDGFLNVGNLKTLYIWKQVNFIFHKYVCSRILSNFLRKEWNFMEVFRFNMR